MDAVQTLVARGEAREAAVTQDSGPVCARCHQGGGVVACPYCARLFHSTKSAPCLERHLLEAQGDGKHKGGKG